MSVHETSKEKLLNIFKPRITSEKERKVGVEIEHIGFVRGKPITFPQMQNFLIDLSEKYQWQTIKSESQDVIGLVTPMGKISLEPGSQLEFAANIQKDVKDIQKLYQEFKNYLEPIQKKHSIEWLDVALNPISSVEDISIIPSRRYEIMTEYFKNRGTLSTAMMRLTSSIQINFDYLSYEEAIEMLKVGIFLTPVAYSLFSNSRMFKNKDTGFRSYRAEIWRNTDPDRSGLIPELFSKKDFSIEDYVDIVRTRPLMYVQNLMGENIPAEGLSLKDIENGKIPNCIVDNNNLVNAYRELFFEARIKPGYVEIRSVDYLPEPHLYFAISFWKGILYSKKNRQTVLEYYKDFSYDELNRLWVKASQSGLSKDIVQYFVSLSEH